MATRRATDPEVDAMVESIRDRLLRAPDRAGALRYVHFALGGWNGEPLPDRDVADEERWAEHHRLVEARKAEQACCPDCVEHLQRWTSALEEFFARVKRHCPDHPDLVFNQSTTPTSNTLRKAGISSERQAQYQRRMLSLLAGRA